MQIYRSPAARPLTRFVTDPARSARERGFVIPNEGTTDMARTFSHHGMEVAADSDLHMVQVCKPEKASKSLAINPGRAVFLPKFVVSFSDGSATRIRFKHYRTESTRQLLDDPDSPESPASSSAEIVAMNEEAR